MHDKAYSVDDWLQAEREFIKDPDFEIRVNRHVDKEMKSYPHKWKVRRDKIVKIIKIKYIRCRAYYIWLDRRHRKPI